MDTDNFNYENKEVKLQNGGKMVRKVLIKNGKGHKTVTKYYKGKQLFSIKKPIHKSHIHLIKNGKFIPGLFRECNKCYKTSKSKTRRK